MDPPPVYLPNEAPDKVLENLQRAYKNRDSTVIEELYDPAYEGTSVDLSDQNPQVLFFTWEDERRTVGGLRRSPTVSSVFLDLGLPSSWGVYDSTDLANPDWVEIQIGNVRLQVADGQFTYDASSGTDVITFKFKPYPEPSFFTGKRWRIVRWQETRSAKPT